MSDDLIERLRHMAKVLGVGSFDIPALLNEAAEALAVGVPREPTEAMLSAYHNALGEAVRAKPPEVLSASKGRPQGHRLQEREKAIARWQAMFDAAQHEGQV